MTDAYPIQKEGVNFSGSGMDGTTKAITLNNANTICSIERNSSLNFTAPKGSVSYTTRVTVEVKRFI